MRDSFAQYHPLVNLLYFTLVLCFSFTLIHPLAQGITLFGACVYCVSVEGKKRAWFIIKYCIPMLFLTAFINPIFNHEGMTILVYLRNGNPLTLESILYGLSAGAMLITVLIWFSSINRVMTTDKLIYLLGKLVPALSLVLSMSLRFVPKFKAQMTTVVEAQRCIGKDVYNGSILKRIKIAISVISIMITWSLENAIETADSMKSRGYGLKGRTAFSIYSFVERDFYMLVWLIFCGLFLLAGTIVYAFGFRYFPNIRYAAFDMTTIPFYCIYIGLVLTPVVINLKEERKWKALYSKM